MVCVCARACVLFFVDVFSALFLSCLCAVCAPFPLFVSVSVPVSVCALFFFLLRLSLTPVSLLPAPPQLATMSPI